MSDSVTPVEEIRAAIEKLTGERLHLKTQHNVFAVGYEGSYLRIIDPVLAILEDAAIPYPEDGRYYINDLALALARSILTPATNGEPQ